MIRMMNIRYFWRKWWWGKAWADLCLEADLLIEYSDTLLKKCKQLKW